jgi:hypothetical protein
MMRSIIWNGSDEWPPTAGRGHFISLPLFEGKVASGVESFMPFATECRRMTDEEQSGFRIYPKSHIDDKRRNNQNA